MRCYKASESVNVLKVGIEHPGGDTLSSSAISGAKALSALSVMVGGT